MEQVTETIRRCPLLWNTDLEKCRDSNLKDTAWGEIAEQLGQNKANLKEEWRKLRDHHHQALFQKKIKSGQSATKFKPWKYEQQMEFLVTTVKHRKCDTNIPPMDQSVVGGTVPDCDRPLTPGDESITDIEENEETCPLPSTNASTPGESRNHHHRHMDKLINYLQEKPSTKRRAPKADDLDLFFARNTRDKKRIAALSLRPAVTSAPGGRLGGGWGWSAWFLWAPSAVRERQRRQHVNKTYQG
ncbi:uncharacterized protein LOC124798792 [Schistocerca piceifrons]|uniref:uncharacterized protein LOC124798792 n=1 Tax=Schistocerca piceifrons TaxID=274613 RepID=UPI001F5EC96C|nr:uncharacterized protein LOC124798792 [Schistocerca piceifrons]